MERNANLDLIKLLSCMGVCSLHFFLRYMMNDVLFRWEYVLFYAAGMAIPLFFMVNGYLLLAKERPRSYYLKKIVNIIKIVLTVNILWFVLLSVVRRGFQPNPFIESFKNLFLQQGYFGIYWFFGSLIIIYALLAIIPYRFFTTKFYILSIIVFAIIQFVVNELNLNTTNQSELFEANIPQTFRLYNHINYFLIGGLMRNALSDLKINKFCCYGGVFLCIVMETIKCNSIYGMWWVEFLQCNLITTIGVVCFFNLLMNLRIRKRTNIIIGLLGPCVMLVFIIHEALVNRFVVLDAKFPIIYLIGFWICCFGISFFLNKVKPINKFFKI